TCYQSSSMCTPVPAAIEEVIVVYRLGVCDWACQFQRNFAMWFISTAHAQEGLDLNGNRASQLQAAIDAQISRVRERRTAYNADSFVDTSYKGHDVGGYVFEASLLDTLIRSDRVVEGYRLDKINIRAAQGLITEPGFMSGCIDCIQRGSTTLVIGARPSMSLQDILAVQARYFRTARLIDAPVYVVSNGPEVFAFLPRGST